MYPIDSQKRRRGNFVLLYVCIMYLLCIMLPFYFCVIHNKDSALRSVSATDSKHTSCQDQHLGNIVELVHKFKKLLTEFARFHMLKINHNNKNLPPFVTVTASGTSAASKNRADRETCHEPPRTPPTPQLVVCLVILSGHDSIGMVS